MKVTIKLHSTKIHHGARSVEHTEKYSASALSRLKKNINPSISSTPPLGEEAMNIKALNKIADRIVTGPKDPAVYGSHNGQNHVIVLGAFETSAEDFSCKIDKYNNAVLFLEGHSTIDIKELKNQYRSKRSEVAEELFQKYGSGISPSVVAMNQNSCAKYSFDYVETQIIIIVTDTAPFVGSHMDELTGLFTCAVKSKKCYTATLLTVQARNAILSMIRTGNIPDGIVISPTAVIARGIVEKSDKGVMRIRSDRSAITASKGKVGSQFRLNPEQWSELEANSN